MAISTHSKNDKTLINNWFEEVFLLISILIMLKTTLVITVSILFETAQSSGALSQGKALYEGHFITPDHNPRHAAVE